MHRSLLLVLLIPPIACADSDLHEHEVIKLFAFKNRLDDGSYRDTLQLRYYRPLQVNDRHQATLRLDTSFYTDDSHSLPEFSLTGLHLDKVKFTLSAKGAQLSENWQSNFGFRTILPVGSSKQLVLAPQIGAVYKPDQGTYSILSDFSPLIRYLHGVDPKDDSAKRIRHVELYPTLGFQLGSKTRLRFWDEYGIEYNTRDGRWFIPIDVMLIQQLTEHQHLAIGFSKALVKSYGQYDWTLYGNLTFYF